MPAPTPAALPLERFQSARLYRIKVFVEHLDVYKQSVLKRQVAARRWEKLKPLVRSSHRDPRKQARRVTPLDVLNIFGTSKSFKAAAVVPVRPAADMGAQSIVWRGNVWHGEMAVRC